MRKTPRLPMPTPVRLHAVLATLLVAGTAAWTASPALASEALAIFKGADLAEGERLINEHKCAACHIRKVGGDGSAIFRPTGRINSPPALRGMVEMCNTELNLGMFPEEVTSVAAVLQRDHYRFGAPASASGRKP
jgi:hypothetical protein